MSEQTAAPEVGVGTVLAETYEVTSLLGRGGMGTVWAARHLRLPGKRVAVKVLHGAVATDREAYARFRREAEIASQIGHPNIIEVHDFNTVGATPYLVLEFLAGEDLAARIARGAIPLDETLRIVRQIGSALHAAHRAGVVHRDLKPGNVFLCPTDMGGVVADRVKVLDFGISKIRGSQTVQTQDSVLLGTPQYMSPEQASGANQEIDQRTDVFALGAIVFEMLSGRAAFSGGNLVAVIYKVVYEKTPSLSEAVPSLPPHVVAAVDRAMAKEAGARFPDVASFIEALTGSPLQTLDRQPVASVDPALAATVAATPSPIPATTGARGELSPVPPTRVGERTSWWTPVRIAAVAAGVAAAGVGGAVAVVKMSPPKPTPVAIPVAVPVAPATIDLAHAPPPDLARPVDLSHLPDLVAPRAATPRTPRIETLLPEVAADLEEAERALSSRPDEAIRLARRTLTRQKSSRAFAIMTRAYCKLGDLGNAKASFLSVTGSDRAPTIRACKAAGIDP